MVTLRRISNFVKLKNKQKSKKFLCKLHKKSQNSLSLEHLFALVRQSGEALKCQANPARTYVPVYAR